MAPGAGERPSEELLSAINMVALPRKCVAALRSD
jgi:hypothetical protein